MLTQCEASDALQTSDILFHSVLVCSDAAAEFSTPARVVILFSKSVPDHTVVSNEETNPIREHER